MIAVNCGFHASLSPPDHIVRYLDSAPRNVGALTVTPSAITIAEGGKSSLAIQQLDSQLRIRNTWRRDAPGLRALRAVSFRQQGFVLGAIYGGKGELALHLFLSAGGRMVELLRRPVSTPTALALVSPSNDRLVFAYGCQKDLCIETTTSRGKTLRSKRFAMHPDAVALGATESGKVVVGFNGRRGRRPIFGLRLLAGGASFESINRIGASVVGAGMIRGVPTAIVNVRSVAPLPFSHAASSSSRAAVWSVARYSHGQWRTEGISLGFRAGEAHLADEVMIAGSTTSPTGGLRSSYYQLTFLPQEK